MGQVRNGNAPGWPGLEPRWTSSKKTGVGTALNSRSRVWFTLSHGIFDEIYYPRVDIACTRDMGLIVTDGHEFFSEEKRHANSQVETMAEGVPAYRLINTCMEGRYRIEKEIFASPRRDAIMQYTRFVPLQGSLQDYHVYALLAPHLDNHGMGNTAWISEYKGMPMLFAERNGFALALACSTPWLLRSVGFVGVSDGWQDLHDHRRMTWAYERAENGNVALTGEVDLNACGGAFLLSIGFGLNVAEAGLRARACLLDDYKEVCDKYVHEWQLWQHTLPSMEKVVPDERDLHRISMAVLRTHEAKSFRGGLIASLSIPWGFAKGDEDLGGYHLVWPRDLVEATGGLLAAGSQEDVRRVLHYLQVTQEVDGRWPQNMWLDGTAYWTGLQMDETALPIVLVDRMRHEQALDEDEVHSLWPMVRLAAGFLVRNGPVTGQDRWEMDAGYSPFTLGAEIAALLAAADLADLEHESEVATYLRETADYWNDHIEHWIYVTDTEVDREVGVEGHYVRIAPPLKATASSPRHGFVPIKHQSPGQSDEPADDIISPDALALVRFGLRAPDDPRILNTVKVIDAVLKVDTPYGPTWHRYPDDNYGEHDDGAPFDGTGHGRGWPLLTGERAHYELAAGRRDEAIRLLQAMEAFANEGGMIPEQVWDSGDIPQDELFCGRPSGSAMPLVWAHAEYVKLRRSLQEGRVFDTPPQPVERYQRNRTSSPYAIWRFNNKIQTMPPGKVLRLEALMPAVVRWSTDGWDTAQDMQTHDTGLGVHLADLPTEALSPDGAVQFTFFWPGSERWEETNYEVAVVDGRSS